MPKTGRLIVLNKDDNSVSFIRCSDGATLAKLPVGANPHEVAISPDARLSYVTNSGGNTLSLIDNDRMTEVGRVGHPEFRFPHGVALTPDGKYLWLASTRSDRVFVFETAGLTAETVLATGQTRTHMISTHPGLVAGVCAQHRLRHGDPHRRRQPASGQAHRRRQRARRRRGTA